jgi:hypothetical protein
VRFGRTGANFEALLDTGFDGDVVVPERLVADAGSAGAAGQFQLADGTRIIRPTYNGTVAVGQLGVYPARVVALGGECMIGMRRANRFSITLDHGQRVIVEP